MSDASLDRLDALAAAATNIGGGIPNLLVDAAEFELMEEAKVAIPKLVAELRQARAALRAVEGLCDELDAEAEAHDRKSLLATDRDTVTAQAVLSSAKANAAKKVRAAMKPWSDRG